MNIFNKLIIVQHQYASTTPKTQRMLAAAKQYVENGLEVVFIVSTDDAKFDTIQGVRFVKITENRKKLIQSFFHFQHAIKREYDAHSVILFYEVPLYAFLFRKKKYNVFSEVTEIPFYGKKLTLSKKIIAKIRLNAIRGFSGLMVISKALKEYYQGHGITNIEVINMFVDASRFEKLQKQLQKNNITYCGRISYQKDGVNDLITAFSLITSKHPDYELKLIGAFENAEVEIRLKQLIKELNIEDKVRFTGLIDAKELPQHLKNANVLALARPDNIQAKYGFPTKLGEYLATGNPVVVTKVGEIPLYLKDKENAFLSEPNNPQNLAYVLDYVISNPDEAKRVGREGVSLTNSSFSSKFQTECALKFIRDSI